MIDRSPLYCARLAGLLAGSVLATVTACTIPHPPPPGGDHGPPSTGGEHNPPPDPPRPTGLISSRDFTSSVTRGPTGRTTLAVTGTVRMASPGYDVRLTPRPPGDNRNVLVLDLITTPPDGPVTGVLVDVPVRYEQVIGLEIVSVKIPELELELPVTRPRPTGDLPWVVQVGEFSAWMNRQPVGPPRLHVAGAMVVPSGHYRPRLQVSPAQGPDPQVLELELVVDVSEGGGHAETEVEVRFDADGPLDVNSVEINPIGLVIPVREAH